SVNSPYPNVDQYTRLWQQQGALQARNRGLGYGSVFADPMKNYGGSLPSRGGLGFGGVGGGMSANPYTAGIATGGYGGGGGMGGGKERDHNDRGGAPEHN